MGNNCVGIFVILALPQPLIQTIFFLCIFVRFVHPNNGPLSLSGKNDERIGSQTRVLFSLILAKNNSYNLSGK